MFGLLTLIILGLLIAAFVQVQQQRRKVADLESLTARLRKEVDGIGQRLQALEGQADANVPPLVPVAVDSVAPVPTRPPAPVPQAAEIKVAEVAKVVPAAAPVPPKPAQPTLPHPARPVAAAPNTPSWIAHPDGLL
ncbi:MAG: hypothetical protein RSD99_23750, partial [Janthinobacterium sp.]